MADLPHAKPDPSSGTIKTATSAKLPPAGEKRGAAFSWPTPPYASYPAATEQTEPLACEITGLYDKPTPAYLTFFSPTQSVAYVQLPPTRTTALLRFDRFRLLTLMTPLLPQALAATDPHASLLNQRATSPFTVSFVNGGDLRGITVGHVETSAGLFLFPPFGADGAVKRVFVPRVVFTGFEVGARIGEVLVGQNRVTEQQVRKAIDMQENLRSQKVGDILVSGKIVSPDQLLEAIARQDKMPLARIGQALLSLGMVADGQLNEALAQQRLDRGVPLGEVLVRMGVVSREDLQTALASKMGYPLVDLDTFPFEIEALRKLSYGVAMRLRVMPLLVRDGRLVVALDDPARREAIDEIEFSTAMNVVPVLAHGRSIESVLPAPTSASLRQCRGGTGSRPSPRRRQPSVRAEWVGWARLSKKRAATTAWRTTTGRSSSSIRRLPG